MTATAHEVAETLPKSFQTLSRQEPFRFIGAIISRQSLILNACYASSTSSCWRTKRVSLASLRNASWNSQGVRRPRISSFRSHCLRLGRKIILTTGALLHKALLLMHGWTYTGLARLPQNRQVGD